MNKKTAAALKIVPGEPNPAAAILIDAVRAKCADCNTFAWATPEQPDAACQCGKLRIVKREIVEGNTARFNDAEFVAAFMEER